MKLITEVYETLEYISEANEDGEKEFFIEGVFMQANQKNRNGRIYPTNVLEREVARYNKEYVEKNRAFGELGHPTGPTINLDRASHLIKELVRDGDNFVGKAKIMDTPMGNIVKNLMNERGVTGMFKSESFGPNPAEGFYGSNDREFIALPRTVGISIEKSF